MEEYDGEYVCAAKNCDEPIHDAGDMCAECQQEAAEYLRD